MTKQAHRNGLQPLVGAVVLAVIATVFAAIMLFRGNTDAVAADSGELSSTGVQLVMIEDPGCPYCARWTKEIGGVYPASDEGRFAPLVRRQRNHPDVAGFRDIVFSPTFIVVRDGLEIGRIVGYPGQDFFWGMLDQILARAGFKA